jgi:hypothetical protein
VDRDVVGSKDGRDFTGLAFAIVAGEIYVLDCSRQSNINWPRRLSECSGTKEDEEE